MPPLPYLPTPLVLRLRADTERTFAIVLENDDAVLRWMRPSPKQFNIWYGAANTKRYEPDFVVETADGIYMVETKAERNVEDKDVKEKAKAAMAYCEAASKWNADHGGKPWYYALVSHVYVRTNSSFEGILGSSKTGEEEQSFFIVCPPPQVSSPHSTSIRVRAFLHPHVL